MSQKMIKVPASIVFLLAMIAVSFAEDAPTFEREVLPVLTKSCVSCHGPDKQKSGFRADGLDGFVNSGKNGPWVVPGDSENSKIIQLLSGRMRLKKDQEKHQLPASQVQMLRLWIDSGAR